MACALGLPELANHNPFVKDLEELGTRSTSSAATSSSTVCPTSMKRAGCSTATGPAPLDLNGAVIDPPTNNHQAWWRGTRPCDQQKRAVQARRRSPSRHGHT